MSASELRRLAESICFSCAGRMGFGARSAGGRTLGEWCREVVLNRRETTDRAERRRGSGAHGRTGGAADNPAERTL
jgi:hypothetical protein